VGVQSCRVDKRSASTERCLVDALRLSIYGLLPARKRRFARIRYDCIRISGLFSGVLFTLAMMEFAPTVPIALAALLSQGALGLGGLPVGRSYLSVISGAYIAIVGVLLLVSQAARR